MRGPAQIPFPPRFPPRWRALVHAGPRGRPSAHCSAARHPWRARGAGDPSGAPPQASLGSCARYARLRRGFGQAAARHQGVEARAREPRALFVACATRLRAPPGPGAHGSVGAIPSSSFRRCHRIGHIGVRASSASRSLPRKRQARGTPEGASRRRRHEAPVRARGVERPASRRRLPDASAQASASERSCRG